MFGFSRLNKWWHFAISLLALALSVVFIFLYSKDNSQKWIMIVAVGSMIIFSLSSNFFITKLAAQRYRKKRIKRKIYEPKTLDELEDSLKKANFELHKESFGVTADLVIDKVYFRISVIVNEENYFNPNRKEEKRDVKGVNQCEELVAVDFFINANKDLIDRISDYPIATQKILYTTFYFDNDGTLVEANHIDKNNQNANFSKLLEMLEIVEKKENV